MSSPIVRFAAPAPFTIFPILHYIPSAFGLEISHGFDVSGNTIMIIGIVDGSIITALVWPVVAHLLLKALTILPASLADKFDPGTSHYSSLLVWITAAYLLVQALFLYHSIPDPVGGEYPLLLPLLLSLDLLLLLFLALTTPLTTFPLRTISNTYRFLTTPKSPFDFEMKDLPAVVADPDLDTAPVPPRLPNIYAPGTKHYAAHCTGGPGLRVDDPIDDPESGANQVPTKGKGKLKKKRSKTKLSKAEVEDDDASRSVGGFNLRGFGIVVTTEVEVVSEPREVVEAKDRAVAMAARKVSRIKRFFGRK